MTSPAPSPQTDFVTRFAPSPTGDLHRGHAFSALTAFQAAKAAGGRFILRIEDIDRTRCRPQYEAAIYEDLAWLGLDWEEPVRRQSQHMADYGAALRELSEETGVEAELLGLVEVADGLFGKSHYVLIDYAARWTGGEPRAGDDAAAAAFHPLAALDGLGMWDETVRVIRLAAERFGA